MAIGLAVVWSGIFLSIIGLLLLCLLILRVEAMKDGSQVCWISEAAPSPGQYRLKGTVGIRLSPNSSCFETIVKIDNRTPVKHPFMWWENGAVHVNKDYQLFFPQDVNCPSSQRSGVTMPRSLFRKVGMR